MVVAGVCSNSIEDEDDFVDSKAPVQSGGVDQLLVRAGVLLECLDLFRGHVDNGTSASIWLRVKQPPANRLYDGKPASSASPGKAPGIHGTVLALTQQKQSSRTRCPVENRHSSMNTT
jgi:hypothetical protein